MFKCAAESLSTLESDKRFVGCKVSGFFGVLHTWGRQIQHHPHVHFVIPGGGLSRASCSIHNLWVDNMLYYARDTRSTMFLVCFARKACRWTL